MMFGSVQEFPLFFGTVLFALEAIGVVSNADRCKIWHSMDIEMTRFFHIMQILPLENEMKTPKAFGGNSGVLNQAMIMIVLLYVGMGLFGYLNYGAAALGSITLNLPKEET